MTGLQDLITRVLERNGWNQGDLADQLGVSASAVTGWRKGRYPPSMENTIRLAALAGEDAAPYLRAAGHLDWTPEQPEAGIIPSIREELALLTAEEQSRFALRAVRLAVQLALELRGSSQ